MSTMTRVATLTVSGSAHTRGLGQGEALRAPIAGAVGRWLEALGRRHETNPQEYISEFLAATSHRAAIERWIPELLEEIRGIAEGSGQLFETMLAYNLLDEEWSYGERRGCTAAGFTSPDGRVIIGQTMDIPVVHDGSQVVVDHLREGAPNVTVFTAAGMVALMGANSAGVGVMVNNLGMLPASMSGLPVLCVVRGALEHTKRHDAAAFVESVPHAIGQHYLIGDPDGMISLEGSADGVTRDQTVLDQCVHTNHPLLSEVADSEETYARSNSRRRFERMTEMMPGLQSAGDLERALSDTLAPISREPMRGMMSFGAMVAELGTPPVLSFAPGPPHLRPFRSFA